MFIEKLIKCIQTGHFQDRALFKQNYFVPNFPYSYLKLLIDISLEILICSLIFHFCYLKYLQKLLQYKEKFNIRICIVNNIVFQHAVYIVITLVNKYTQKAIYINCFCMFPWFFTYLHMEGNVLNSIDKKIMHIMFVLVKRMQAFLLSLY